MTDPTLIIMTDILEKLGTLFLGILAFVSGRIRSEIRVVTDQVTKIMDELKKINGRVTRTEQRLDDDKDRSLSCRGDVQRQLDAITKKLDKLE